MRETKEVTQTVEWTSAIICNKCGRTCKIPEESGDLELQEFLSVEWHGGYGSIFGDELHCSLDLCQHCVMETVGKYVMVMGHDGKWQKWGDKPEGER